MFELDLPFLIGRGISYGRGKLARTGRMRRSMGGGGDSHGGRMKLRQLMNHEQYRRNRARVYDLYAFGANEACFARHQDKLPCFFTPDVYWRTWRADRIYDRIAPWFPVRVLDIRCSFIDARQILFARRWN